MNPNIPDYSQPSVPSTPSSPSDDAAKVHGSKSELDYEKSELAKSMAMAMILTPLMSMPILPVYSQDGDSTLVAIASGKASNGSVDITEAFILSQQISTDKVKDDILAGWSKNIREIAEQVRLLLRSPIYQQEQELRLKGEPATGKVAGAETATAALHAASSAGSIQSHPAILGFVEHLQTLEKIPPTVKIHDTTAPDDPAKMMTIPIMASFLAGGALVLGTVEMSTSITGMSSNPAQSVMEYIQHLQPSNAVLLADVVPVINLVVMPLIYFSSWDASVGSMHQKERQNHLSTAMNFAKKVIQLVSDPAFSSSTFVNTMEETGQFPPEKKAQFSAMLKLILATVGLSLLYAAEVGKMAGSQFGGMEPAEFRGMLSGEIPVPDPSKGKLSETDQAKLTLIKLIHAQLAALPEETRAMTLEATFEYLASHQKIEDMTDPSTVFTEVLASNAFSSEAAGLGMSPV